MEISSSFKQPTETTLDLFYLYSMFVFLFIFVLKVKQIFTYENSSHQLITVCLSTSKVSPFAELHLFWKSDVSIPFLIF